MATRARLRGNAWVANPLKNKGLNMSGSWYVYELIEPRDGGRTKLGLAAA
jgi:hypothetical protein